MPVFWGGVYNTLTDQGTWSAQESKRPIIILELRAIRYLQYWTSLLQSHPVKAQSNTVKAGLA